MHILALETSGKSASVALMSGPQCLLTGEIRPDQRAAAHLTPLIADLLRTAKVPPQEVAAVAVTVGPGSFTGLRVGVTTAKVFAFATGAKLVAIDTLSALAAQVTLPYDRLEVVMDAQRKELVVASFSSDGSGPPTAKAAPRILGQQEWLDTLKPGTLVCGPALAKISTYPSGVQVAHPDGSQLFAETVGKLGWQAVREGQFADVWGLAPTYFRKSAAEEKQAAASKLPAANRSTSE